MKFLLIFRIAKVIFSEFGDIFSAIKEARKDGSFDETDLDSVVKEVSEAISAVIKEIVYK